MGFSNKAALHVMTSIEPRQRPGDETLTPFICFTVVLDQIASLIICN